MTVTATQTLPPDDARLPDEFVPQEPEHPPLTDEVNQENPSTGLTIRQIWDKSSLLQKVGLVASSVFVAGYGIHLFVKSNVLPTLGKWAMDYVAAPVAAGAYKVYSTAVAPTIEASKSLGAWAMTKLEPVTNALAYIGNIAFRTIPGWLLGKVKGITSLLNSYVIQPIAGQLKTVSTLAMQGLKPMADTLKRLANWSITSVRPLVQKTAKIVAPGIISVRRNVLEPAAVGLKALLEGMNTRVIGPVTRAVRRVAMRAINNYILPSAQKMAAGMKWMNTVAIRPMVDKVTTFFTKTVPMLFEALKTYASDDPKVDPSELPTPVEPTLVPTPQIQAA